MGKSGKWKMHFARAAIIENGRTTGGEKVPWRTIVQATAVFPYREQVDGGYRESLLWKSLAKIGIGAVPLLPGDEGYLREWLCN